MYNPRNDFERPITPTERFEQQPVVNNPAARGLSPHVVRNLTAAFDAVATPANGVPSVVSFTNQGRVSTPATSTPARPRTAQQQ